MIQPNIFLNVSKFLNRSNKKNFFSYQHNKIYITKDGIVDLKAFWNFKTNKIYLFLAIMAFSDLHSKSQINWISFPFLQFVCF